MACSGCSPKVTARELLTRIEESYVRKLSIKTGWGKNEALTAYKESVNEVLMGLVEIKSELEGVL